MHYRNFATTSKTTPQAFMDEEQFPPSAWLNRAQSAYRWPTWHSWGSPRLLKYAFRLPVLIFSLFLKIRHLSSLSHKHIYYPPIHYLTLFAIQHGATEARIQSWCDWEQNVRCSLISKPVSPSTPPNHPQLSYSHNFRVPILSLRYINTFSFAKSYIS